MVESERKQNVARSWSINSIGQIEKNIAKQCIKAMVVSWLLASHSNEYEPFVTVWQKAIEND